MTAVNGLAVLGLLEQVKHLRDTEGYDPRICQASSSEMFGLVTELPQTEGSPHHPRSPYAVSKSFAHHTAVNYRESYGMFVAAAILFNHESPLRPDSFVTRKITAGAAAIALGKQETLTLGRLDVRRDWGAPPITWWPCMPRCNTTSRTPSTSPPAPRIRSTTSCMRPSPRPGWRTIANASSPTPGLLRPADVPETRGDASKARELLGWTPTRTFDQIVESMVAADLTRLTSGVRYDVAYL